MKHRKEPGLQEAPGDCEQQTTNPLQTVAERSAWKATAIHADVMAFCRALVERSPQVTLEIVGKTYEGRELPLLILADPPIATPTEARHSGKLVCFAFGAIHAGEVCGKEGLLILAREIALTSNHPLLHDLVILFAPLMNADGNERMHPHNRPGQDGPEQGMGTRLNAMGLNLNRDWTKLETPENRAFARLMSRWDPAVILDLHATNGSRHQYILTYDAPRHPAAHADVRTYTRDHFLPAAGTALEAATGYRSFFYGNFDHDNTMWRTYAGLPRFTTHYG
jgi:dipeptidyl-peptidase 4